MTKATSAIPFSVWRKIAMATWRPTGGGRRPLEGRARRRPMREAQSLGVTLVTHSGRRGEAPEPPEVRQQSIPRHRLRPVVSTEVGVRPSIDESTLPHRKSAASDSMKSTQSASCPASPNPPIGTGKERMRFASFGVDSPSSRRGVIIAPGARAFRRMPAPAHSVLTASRRTQRLTATLDAAYTNTEAFLRKNLTERTAFSASCARNARTVRAGTMGVVVVELLEKTTTFARSAAASAGRHASSSSTTPK